MSRDSNGTYTLPAGNPVTSGAVITSSWANNTLSDIGTEITNSLDKSGRTTPTANLPMGSFKFTGLAAGTAAGDSIRFEQVNSYVAYPTVTLTASSTALGSSFAETTLLTGTGVTVTAFSASTVGVVRKTVFDGINTLTHSASFSLLTSANVTTAAGDMAEWLYTSAGWKMLDYSRATGESILGGSSFPSGTVSSPGIKFTSDADTGFYLFGSNTLGFAAGGVSVANWSDTNFNLTPAGNFAITPTGASTTVTINGSTSGTGAVTIQAGATGQNLQLFSGATAYTYLGQSISRGIMVKGATGHLYLTSKNNPSVTAGGGTGVVISGRDQAFRVGFGTGAGTTLTVTFGDAISEGGSSPYAICTPAGAAVAWTASITSLSSSAISFSFSSAPASGDGLYVIVLPAFA